MIDHAQLPSIANASLPQSYEQAKTALAECSTMDECKDWADKAAALASYAKMSKDDSLRKMAERIQARAIRRCGELLRQIEPAHGANQNISEGDRTIVTRSSLAEDAGLSKHQQVQATRLANIPTDEFTKMVESDTPPTVTKLAEIGTKRQLIDLKGRDPSHFNKALHFVGDFESYARQVIELDVDSTVAILTDTEREEVAAAVRTINRVHESVIRCIKKYDTPAPQRETLPQSRGKGIQYAHEAINALKRIPLSDGLRQDAFDMVMDWIKTNR